MNNIIEWVFDNKEWLLSGIAIAIPIAIWNRYSNQKSIQKQEGGDKSFNLQVGNDLNINNKEDKNNDE